MTGSWIERELQPTFQETVLYQTIVFTTRGGLYGTLLSSFAKLSVRQLGNRRFGEGLELPDIAAARVVALKTIVELIHDQIAKGGRIDLSHSLEVFDGDRRTLLLLPFRELVEG